MKYHKEIIRLLTQPELPDSAYYHFSVIIDPKAGLQWSTQTQWCDYTNEKPQREIREGALFYGEEQRKWLHDIGRLTLLINDEADLKYFYSFGGNALILQSIAEKRFQYYIAPHVCLRDLSSGGFVSARNLSEQQLKYAPSKKLRMEVLTRDGRRCLICGRSPAYYVDVELHVHHAIPWSRGGITEEQNLITICKTCHDGLDPHFDSNLVNLLREKYPSTETTYFDDLQHYQTWIRANMEEAT